MLYFAFIYYFLIYYFDTPNILRNNFTQLCSTRTKEWVFKWFYLIYQVCQSFPSIFFLKTFYTSYYIKFYVVLTHMILRAYYLFFHWIKKKSHFSHWLSQFVISYFQQILIFIIMKPPNEMFWYLIILNQICSLPLHQWLFLNITDMCL